MIQRLFRGRPAGFDRAVVGRVEAREPGRVRLESQDGARVVLSAGAPEAEPGLYTVREPERLQLGDVVLVSPGGAELLFREHWVHNFLLVTQRCDSLCVMCSQPPRDADDSERADLLVDAVQLMPEGLRAVTLTGGEPTLLGERLVRLIATLRERSPSTAVHVLSNGRTLGSGTLAERVGAVGHPDLMFGVPLYADHDRLHDWVVQAPGAFDQTLLGLENLARAGVPIEIRVVLHRPSVERLPQICEFVWRNLPYVAQVVLMGLEPTGYAVPNMDRLWIDPSEALPAIEAAVEHLAARGMTVRLYNTQLCTLPERLRPYAARSISDWKNEYLPACASCAARDACCGFFASSVRRGVVSSAIRPLLPEREPA